MTSAIALIDGEHYAPVVRDALAELPYDFAGAFLVGGTEKLLGGEDYGVPLVDDLEAAIAELEPAAIVDLSDEPVLGPRERFRFASLALAHGVPYVGPDFRFDVPVFEPFGLPSIGIVGTGKRVGKTAVASHAARLYARDRSVLVVAMGRGGPAQPEVAEAGTSLDRLLELAGEGHHAASDYLEDAALAGAEHGLVGEIDDHTRLELNDRGLEVVHERDAVVLSSDQLLGPADEERAGEVVGQLDDGVAHDRRIVLTVDQGDCARLHRVVTSSSMRAVYFSNASVSVENWMIFSCP
jgi:predicted GTPase